MFFANETLAKAVADRLKAPTPLSAGAESLGLDEPTFEVAEIQGDILPGFTTKHQALMGVRFLPGRLERCKGVLAELLPNISTFKLLFGFRSLRRARRRTGDASADRLPAVGVNIAFSIDGLRLLGANVEGIHDAAFVNGMHSRSGDVLGDPSSSADPGHKSHWITGGRAEDTPHAFLIFASDDPAFLRKICAAVQKRMKSSKAFEPNPYLEEGHVLPGEVEHFGFRDGISQPGVRGRVPGSGFATRRLIDLSDPRSAAFAAPGKPLVWPGSFIVGYPTQLPADPTTPGPLSDAGQPWMRNGAFLVFRRLKQNVQAFREFFRTLADSTATVKPLSQMSAQQRTEWLAARTVGRWPSGAPVMRHPEMDAPAVGADSLENNHFQYRDQTDEIRISDRNLTGCPADFLGRICPMWSHIRKVNPRDIDTDKDVGEATRGFQMLRRGIPFGPLFDQDPAAERGLLFLSFQSSIPGHFELLTHDWMNTFTAPQGNGFDLLVGQNNALPRNADLSLPSQTVSVTVQSPFIVPTGGGYFFVPSITTLRHLLAGA